MKENIIMIASDHAGFILKEKIIEYLTNKKFKIENSGCFSEASVDYPDYAEKLCSNLKNNIGILICGTGIGMSIYANRRPNIRAALCLNEEMAILARQHNDANILVLGARLIDTNLAIKCIDSFLKTDFLGGKHQIRINKLTTSKQ
jgi:ribose 5-phosphate isomerase B